MTKTRILGLLAAAASLSLSGCNSSLFATSTSSAQTEIVTAARVLRLYQGFARTIVADVITTPADTVQYDGNLYYYRATLSGAVTTITYYQDSGGTISEGTATITNTTPSGATTQTFTVALALTGLNRPVATVTSPTPLPLSLTIGPGNSPVTLTGSLTETSSSGAFPMTITVTNTSGVITGSLTGTVFGVNVALSNLSGTTTGPYAYTLSGTCSAGTSSETFNETINADGSGRSSISDGTQLEWSSGGGATLITPNSGGNINIANIDGGQ